ncbi:MAG: YgiT-type zinc finger protein [Desulfobacter postgatei]|uniref:YgiT-type zinc finger protein n=1 Tax=Desulfobacter postgatei TaxID=2293 RepID=UPI0023F43EB7|nr:YgiT-type zinc finger protein [Desulfobacter postgatei]MDD4272672.1 YgiT-type zinc finger protein [Desulfobacter postgatei]
MKCMHCQGTMVKGVAPFHIDKKGYHLTLDEVPAWICQQCGEFYFDEPQVDSIQEIIRKLEDVTERLSDVA